MKHFRVSGRMAFISLIVLAGVTPAALFAQNTTPPPGLDGIIASIQGATITLTLADSTQKVVTLQTGTIILDRQVSAVDQIKPGDALGVTAHRDNGALVASAINIFSPQMWDGVRKGQWPMAKPGDIMTNALTTAYVQAMNGRTLTMKLPDGTMVTITVPDGVTVRRMVTVQASALSVGLRVSIRIATDSAGNTMATSISFDQPMKS
jgi:Domain of unknown function (DUF5666)